MLKTTLCLVQQLSDFGFTDGLMDPLKVSEEASVIAFDGAGKGLAGAPTNIAAQLPRITPCLPRLQSAAAAGKKLLS